MRKILAAIVIAASLIGAPALQARTRLTPDQQLAKLLEGREAGKPVSCISQWDTRHSTVIDKTAIVYDSGAGGTLWVNRPTNARSLDRDDVLVTQLRGSSQLCSVDTVQLLDRSSRFYTGFVGLNEFVPYRKVAGND